MIKVNTIELERKWV